MVTACLVFQADDVVASSERKFPSNDKGDEESNRCAKRPVILHRKLGHRKTIFSCEGKEPTLGVLHDGQFVSSFVGNLTLSFTPSGFGWSNKSDHTLFEVARDVTCPCNISLWKLADSVSNVSSEAVHKIEGVLIRVPKTNTVRWSVFVHVNKTKAKARKALRKRWEPTGQPRKLPNFVFLVIDSLSTNGLNQYSPRLKNWMGNLSSRTDMNYTTYTFPKFHPFFGGTAANMGAMFLGQHLHATTVVQNNASNHSRWIWTWSFSASHLLFRPFSYPITRSLHALVHAQSTPFSPHIAQLTKVEVARIRCRLRAGVEQDVVEPLRESRIHREGI
jgi:hypothetical protein